MASILSRTANNTRRKEQVRDNPGVQIKNTRPAIISTFGVQNRDKGIIYAEM